MGYKCPQVKRPLVAVPWEFQALLTPAPNSPGTALPAAICACVDSAIDGPASSWEPVTLLFLKTR